MYTRRSARGLWGSAKGGLGVPEACRRLPLFPTRANLYRWLRMEAGELAATGCRTGPRACTARARRRAAPGSRRAPPRVRAEVGQATDWRATRGADLPDADPAGAQLTEIKLAGVKCWTSKSTRPASFSQHGEVAGGELAASGAPLAGWDVTETLSRSPRAPYLDPGLRAAEEATPKTPCARGVRASFRGERGRYSAEVGDRGPAVNPGAAVPARPEPGTRRRPSSPPEKVSAIMVEEGLVSRGRPDGAPGEVSPAMPASFPERPLANSCRRRGRLPSTSRARAWLAGRDRRHGVPPRRYKAYLSPAIDWDEASMGGRCAGGLQAPDK